MAPVGVGRSRRSSSATRIHHTAAMGRIVRTAAWSQNATTFRSQIGLRRFLIHASAHRDSLAFMCPGGQQYGLPDAAPDCCSRPSIRGCMKQSDATAAGFSPAAIGKGQLKEQLSRLNILSPLPRRFPETRRTFVDDVGPGLLPRAGQYERGRLANMHPACFADFRTKGLTSVHACWH